MNITYEDYSSLVTVSSTGVDNLIGGELFLRMKEKSKHGSVS